ncbi:MAG: F0F1 ATP synthase subunit alpha, partial [Planctomycetota bacterium]
YLDDVPVDKIKDFENGFHRFMRENYPAVGQEIRQKKRWDDEVTHRLIRAIEEYKKEFSKRS